MDVPCSDVLSAFDPNGTKFEETNNQNLLDYNRHLIPPLLVSGLLLMWIDEFSISTPLLLEILFDQQELIIEPSVSLSMIGSGLVLLH